MLYNSFYRRLFHRNILISQQNRRRSYNDKNSKLVFCRTTLEVDSILFQFIHIFLTALCSKLYTDLHSLHFTHNKNCTATSCALFGVGAPPATIALRNRLRLWTPILSSVSLHYVMSFARTFPLETNTVINIMYQFSSNFLFPIKYITLDLPIVIYILTFRRLLWPSIQAWSYYMKRFKNTVDVKLSLRK